jgi:putative spermidine/putrescine transport system permease protein
MESKLATIALRVWVVLVFLFLFTPIVLIIVYAFNASNIQSWPIAGLSLRWFYSAFANHEISRAILLSLNAGIIATTIAVLLGTAAAFAVHRYEFFGKETVSFFVVLPIALPGIISGMALNSFFVFWGIGLSLWTIIIGHATFCIVIVYNNVFARLKRLPRSLEEASMDLGANQWRTFRRVTLPMISTALMAGALLAFALSFDEVIVTTFTAGAQNTLPLWIFGAIRLGQRLPEVNVIVLVIIAMTFFPVLLAYRLTSQASAMVK